VVGSRTRQPLFLCLRSGPMLDILFALTLEFAKAIFRYMGGLGMYTVITLEPTVGAKSF
jgi:hypothetical protein